MAANPNRKPYSGQRKLVIGIDVGTTFTGVSYSILDPGIVPVIQGIHRFPSQETVGGAAKIPTVILYDTMGIVRAVGSEALDPGMIDKAQTSKWLKVEWFKLHLRPAHLIPLNDAEQLKPLPLGKTVEQVFGDFLRYVHTCTKQYIQETHAGGVPLWEGLKNQTEFILTHPNGWEGAQQSMMRKAAILGGLVPDNPAGHARIHFVTEGEASLHYCIGTNYASEAIKSGQGVIIVDAGGGTVDVSAFRMNHGTNEFEEIAPAICHFQGSVYVTSRARKYLESKLYNSQYGSPDDIEHITSCFDAATKLGFKDTSSTAFIRFGSVRDNDASVDIKNGQLRMPGSHVATFFEPSIAAIRESIREQRAAASGPISSVLLVGGFAGSQWLFSNVQSHLAAEGLSVYRPDSYLMKAVADGAVSFYLDHYVTTRVARTTFGVHVRPLYDQRDIEHRRRINKVFTDSAGDKRVPGAFSVILAKGSRVSEKTVFRQAYWRDLAKISDLPTMTVEILAYRGQNPNPVWIDSEPHMYSVACTVVADVKSAVKHLPRQTGRNGKEYFIFSHEVQLLFGLTEHEAQVSWKERGQEKKVKAEISYDRAIGR